MKRLAILVLTVLVQQMPLSADVRRADTGWELENGALRVSVAEEGARLTVTEKASGLVWQQEDLRASSRADESVQVLRVLASPAIDGDSSDWSQDAPIWTPWVGEDGERNLSGGAYVRWDAENLYVFIRVRDNQAAFGGADPQQWWEADSVEFWVDSVQVGLHLYPGGPAAVDARGNEYAGSRVAVKMIESETLPGFGVEAAVPLGHFPVLRNPVPGVRFFFAIGQNDADPKPGEPTRRAAQGYYPRTWVHSQPQTFAVAVLTDQEGEAPPLDRENDRTSVLFTSGVADLSGDAVAGTVTYSLTLVRGQQQPLPLRVQLALVGDEPALDMTISCPDGNQAPMSRITYPRPLYPEQPETFFLAFADYCDGHYVWAGAPVYRSRWLSVGGSLDMPWVAATDGTRGMMALALTPADCVFLMQARQGDEQQLGFPGTIWEPVKGTWGRDRKLRLQFFDSGGYVAACKAYRRLAEEEGFVRTLRQKAERNPDVEKLMGAVDWWGANGLGFVREAVAEGMAHGLVNGRWAPADMEEMKELGWLVGEYDNYVDIKDSPEIGRARAPVAEHTVVKADGELMTAWIERDADMNETGHYMKHCTAKQLESAKAIMPGVLRQYPYNARFLDVTSAEGPIECYSPDHPTDRKGDIGNRMALQRYFSEDLGLVMGGEHGRWWSVPNLHYHEGMMGGGHYSWPAGYLKDVADRSELSANYLKYGINPANRAPLFELTFHDCVVDYWYWGATNDYLHNVAPEITDRKTALNVLYGTPPMMWVNSHGLRWSVPEEREQMLNIYRNTCKLHEVLGMQQMVSHEFLTEDRMVQRTTWEDGTVCIVNFGGEPYRFVTGPSATAELSENDFYVEGPRIEQFRASREMLDGRMVRASAIVLADTGWTFIDLGDEEVGDEKLTSSGQITWDPTEPGEVRITLGPGAALRGDLTAWRFPWAGPDQRMLFGADDAGAPVRRLEWPDDGGVQLGAPANAKRRFLVLNGQRALVPDVSVTSLKVSADADAAERGLSAIVENDGLAPAQDLTVTFHLDSVDGPVLAAREGVTLGVGERREFSGILDGARADGARRVFATVEGPGDISLTGRTQASASFVGRIDADRFSFRRGLSVAVPRGDAAGLTAQVPLQLDPARVDAGNLRVAFADGSVVPAQFEPEEPGSGRGTLVFCLPDGLAPGRDASAQVLGTAAGSDLVFPHGGSVTAAPDGSLIRARAYQARLSDGTLGSVSVLGEDGREAPAAAQIIVSSAETGWNSEDGTVEEFGMLASGPVRSVFACTKVLSDGTRLKRRWEFYADRFVVESETDRRIGSLNRVAYSTPGTATNATGRRAQMDGRGDGEGFGFQGQPEWYAVFGDTFRNACIALTPPSGFTWWDAGAMGMASLDHTGDGPERRVYIWGPGATDDEFARAAAAAYAEGVRLRMTN